MRRPRSGGVRVDYRRVAASLLTLPAALLAVACASGDSPEIVAIEFLRATRTAESDRAIDKIDLEELSTRVSDLIFVVQEGIDSDKFMRDSIETLVWGLFQETPRQEFVYDAVPGDNDGERATSIITMTSADGTSRTSTVHLRFTTRGWKVSGKSLDDLVNYVVQRLEERY